MSFTGSPATGAWVAAAAAKRHCPVTLELGGKSPQIVFADADLDAALPALVNAIVQNAGQTCSAGSRLLVERSRYEEVLARLGERFAALQAGPALADLDCGPLIRGSQLQRVRTFLADAAKDGIADRRAGEDRRRCAVRRVLRGTHAVARCPRRQSAGLRRSVRPGAGGDAVRRRGRRRAPRQRHRLRTGGGRVDAGWRQAIAHGARRRERTGVHQQLWCGRRRRIAVRRRQALRLRPRKGHRGAATASPRSRPSSSSTDRRHAPREQDCHRHRRRLRLRPRHRAALCRRGREGHRQRRQRRERRAHGGGHRRGRRSCALFAGDVSKDADVKHLVEFALSAFGGLDVVVNNAGTTHKNQPMLDVSEEEFDRIYAGQREEPVPDGAACGAALSLEEERRLHHDRVDGGRAAAAGPHLVQRQQGRGHRDQPLDGGGIGARTTSAST